jgi:hypothetical protein
MIRARPHALVPPPLVAAARNTGAAPRPRPACPMAKRGARHPEALR